MVESDNIIKIKDYILKEDKKLNNTISKYSYYNTSLYVVSMASTFTSSIIGTLLNIEFVNTNTNLQKVLLITLPILTITSATLQSISMATKYDLKIEKLENKKTLYNKVLIKIDFNENNNDMRDITQELIIINQQT